ncbi:hypothetical protein Agub_g2129, partial [Astrephomene gubernaculifera]
DGREERGGGERLRWRRLCDPAKCPLHSHEPTPLIQLMPPPPATELLQPAPATGAPGGPEPSPPDSQPQQPTAHQPAQPPQQPPMPAPTASAAAAAPRDSYDEVDPYAVVPRQLTDALSEALAAALRLQRARDSAAWDPDPGEDFADDYHADELAALAERPPVMIGFAPEALAFSVFQEDWEQEILWDGATERGAGGEVAAGGRAASPLPAKPAGVETEVDAGGRVEAEEVEEEEPSGPEAMEVDGLAEGKGKAAGEHGRRSVPPRAIPVNQPFTLRGIWRGRPHVAPAAELLAGPRARPLMEKTAVAASGTATTSTGAAAPAADAKAALGAAAAAIASAAAAVAGSDPLAAAAAATAAAAAAATAATGGDDGDPRVPLALLGEPQAAPLPPAIDPSAPAPDQRLFVDGTHPQMLRLDTASTADATGFARSTLKYYHPALALSQDDPWVAAAVEAEPGAPPAPLVHNLNDPALIYRAQQPPSSENAPSTAAAAAAAAAATAQSELLRRAAALVAPPVVRRKIVRGPVMEAAHSELIGQQLAAFNVSLDSLYTHQAKARMDRTLKSLAKHGHPAMILTTLPARLTRDELALFHRPRSVWTLAITSQRPTPTMKDLKEVAYKFRSISGTVVSSIYHPQMFGTLGELLQVRNPAGLNALETGFPQHKSLPYRVYGGAPLTALEPETKLVEAGINKQENHLFVVIPALLPVTRPHMPEPGQGTKPPAAFNTKASLTATGGRVLLFEYLEEHPPLLARPAMGARLLTYYQRRDEQDMGHNHLQPPTAPGRGGAGGGQEGGKAGEGAGGAAGGERQLWKLGTVVPLGPENRPFYSPLAPGSSVMCVDTHMFKAPAAPHDPRPSDFLLARSNNGVVHLRELTGALTVGQQHPHERVPEPWDAEWLKTYNSNRVFVQVARLLHTARNRNPNQKPSVKLREVADRLPFIPREEIRQRMEKECGCRPKDGSTAADGGAAVPDNPEYELPEGVQVTEEAKLREMVRPDMVCAHEAMRSSEVRLQSLGLQHLQPLTAVARMEPERWQAAVRQLAELNPKAGPALRLIDWAVNTAPWVTTGSYSSATRGDTKNSTWLRVEGPFDPTGRGYGLCYLADWQRVTRPDLKDKPPQEGSITGTEADLRKLGHEEAGRMLMQWGVKKDVVDAMTNRWRRIDLVRKLATQAAMEGTEGFNAHFVRVQRLNVNEKIASARRTASSILQKQLEALRRDRDWGAAPEDYGLLRPLGRRTQPASAAAAASAADDDEDRRAYLELQREGFLGSGAGGDKAAAKSKKGQPLEAKPKERRIRRVVTLLAPDGTELGRREYVYRDRAEMQVVNRGLNRPEQGGFGQQILQPPAANFMPGPTVRVGAGGGRGRGRGRGRGDGGGGGGEGRGGYKRRRVARAATGAGAGGESGDDHDEETDSAAEEDEEARVMRKMAAGTSRRAGARRPEPSAAAAAAAAEAGEDAAPSPSQGEPKPPPAPKPPRAKPANPKPRKPAAPRQPQQANVCPDCGQPGHGAYSRQCPNWRADAGLSDLSELSDSGIMDDVVTVATTNAGPDSAAVAATADGPAHTDGADAVTTGGGGGATGFPAPSGEAATAAPAATTATAMGVGGGGGAAAAAAVGGGGVSTPVGGGGRIRRRPSRRNDDVDVTLEDDEEFVMSDDEDYNALAEASDDSDDDFPVRSRAGGGGGGGGGSRRTQRAPSTRSAGGGGGGGGGAAAAKASRARQSSRQARTGRTSRFKEEFDLIDDDDEEEEPELERSDHEDVKSDILEEEEEEEWAGSDDDEADDGEDDGSYRGPRGTTSRARSKAAAAATTTVTATPPAASRRQASTRRGGAGGFGAEDVEMRAAATPPQPTASGLTAGGGSYRSRGGGGAPSSGFKRKAVDLSTISDGDEDSQPDDTAGMAPMAASQQQPLQHQPQLYAPPQQQQHLPPQQQPAAVAALGMAAVPAAASAAAAAGRAMTLGQAEAVMRKAYSAVLMAACKVEYSLNFFYKAPSLEVVKDYYNFVPPESVMCLEFIEQRIGVKKGTSTKVGELQYGSPQALQADFQRIHDNCMVYNVPGASPYNYPPARDVAKRMLAAANQTLAKQQQSGSLAVALAAANSMEHWLGC